MYGETDVMPITDVAAGTTHLLRGWSGLIAYAECGARVSHYIPPGSMERTAVTCTVCKVHPDIPKLRKGVVRR